MKVRGIWHPRTEGSFLCYSDSGNVNGTTGIAGLGGDNVTTLNADGSVAASTNNYAASVANGTPVPQNAIPATIDWEAWSKPIERLGETLSGKFDALQSTVREATTPPKDEPTVSAVDFETMTNGELFLHTMGSVDSIVRKAIEAALGPVMQQVQHAQTTATTVDLNRTIDQLKGQHKDFSDWKDEMIGLAKAHPTLGMADLYNLAKSNNPTKAQELHTKYNPPPPRPQPRGFGGLVPGAPSGTAGATKPLTPQQASYEAYQEVQARYSDLLPALQRL